MDLVPGLCTQSTQGAYPQGDLFEHLINLTSGEGGDCRHARRSAWAGGAQLTDGASDPLLQLCIAIHGPEWGLSVY
jgi:hypothetical protein